MLIISIIFVLANYVTKLWELFKLIEEAVQKQLSAGVL